MTLNQDKLLTARKDLPDEDRNIFFTSIYCDSNHADSTSNLGYFSVGKFWARDRIDYWFPCEITNWEYDGVGNFAHPYEKPVCTT